MKHVANTLLKLAANTTRPIGKTLSLLLGWMVLFLCITQPAVAQEVIVHQDFSFDDGDAKRDADGAKNGVVVWKGGAVHVVIGHYDIYPPFGFSTATLIIQAGAIVKIASEFIQDQNGNLISWKPTFNGGIAPYNGTWIEIDGATITDIRDDEVGGDTNGDGNSTTPSHWGIIRFSGTSKDFLKNSTIKYCAKMGAFGSISITDNKFLFCGALASTDGFPRSTAPIMVDAVPVITGNTFEYSYGSSGIIADLRGMTPIVQGNTFRNANATNNAGLAIWIGPAYEYGNYPATEKKGPQSGTTIIVGNTIDIESGIELSADRGDRDSLFLKLPPFRAEIRDNKLQGNGRGIGLTLAFAAEALVSNNTLTNYPTPLTLYYDAQYNTFDATKPSRLRINNNRFLLAGGAIGPGGISDIYWKNGVFVNAENNYWGDPTGPSDNSKADGLFNPRGKGLRIGDGIDYVPFIGGSLPPLQDAIQIKVTSNTAQPFQPATAVTFNVSADYELKSAPTGKIVVLVRDAEGIILNQPGTSLDVTSANQTATLPPVSITVPELSNVVSVEAALVPDNGAESARSNVQPFAVALPAGSLNLNIVELPSGGSPVLGRGNRARVKIVLNYTLTATSNGRFEIEIKERARGTGAVLKEFLSLTPEAPPGNNKSVESEIELDIPLRDVRKEPKSELYVKATLKDGAGVILDRKNLNLPIDETINAVALATCFSRKPARVPRRR